MNRSYENYNPGERLIVPLCANLPDCFGVESLERVGIEERLEQLKQMGVSRIFLAIEAPWGEPEKMAAQKKMLERYIGIFRENGISCGLWFWAGELTGDPERYTRQKMVDGKILPKYCPLDEGHIRGLAGFMQGLATLDVEALMIDDGFRYGFEHGSFGCLCPLHMAAISRIVGREVTEEEMRQALLYGGENELRHAFLKVNGDSLVNFAGRMRQAVDEVKPTLRIAICSAPSSWEIDGTDPETVSRAFAGSTKPWLRLSGAPYWADHRSFGCRLIDAIEFSRMQVALFGKDDMEIMWEGDAYPRPRWNCPAAYLECYDMARAISDEHSETLKYLFDYNSEADNERGYLDRHLRHVPVYQAISGHFDGKTCRGIRVFEVPHKYDGMKIPACVEGNPREMEHICFSMASKILAPVGLPTIYAGEGTGMAVFGENAAYLPRESFGAGLILDARAAELLTERGLDVGLRGDRGYRNVSCEYYPTAKRNVVAYWQKIRELELAPEVEPQSYAGVQGENRSIVGSYRYENAAGQRFFVFCSDAYFADDRYHRVYCRSALLANAVEWMTGKRLPAWTHGSPDLYLLCKEGQDSLSVGLFNLSPDEAFDTEVLLGESYVGAEFFSGSGRLEGERVLLDEIPPFGFVGFTLKKAER